MPYRDANGNRDYGREYKLWGGTAKAKKDRAKVNKARRMVGLKKGDPREVDHKVPLHRGGSNGRSNLRIVSRETNRKKS